MTISAFFSAFITLRASAFGGSGVFAPARHLLRPFISLSIAAAPSAAPGGYLPFTIEPEFNDRFLREKRDAKIEELPAQF